MWIVGFGAICEFAEIRLAGKDCPCTEKTLRHRRVFIGNEVAQYLRSGSCGYPGGEKVVLQRNGNAVKRTAVRPATNFAFSLSSLLPNDFGPHIDIGIQLRIGF